MDQQSSECPGNERESRNGIRPDIRQYLVLLQDALAIKFIPQPGYKNNKDPERRDDNGSSVDSTQDSSLKGIFLFQEFIRANSACLWNPELGSAIASLAYQGTILPSTILVGEDQSIQNPEVDQDPGHLDPHNFVSSISTPLTKVKSAWARKVLKSPPGFKIEFLGEIEELLADPVEPSNFIPLSDSICWAIHELTGTGQSAYVDGILGELGSSFPGTVLPPKELLYEVLERLIQNKKVTQTPKGYFITGTEQDNGPDSDEESIYRKADAGGSAIHKNSSNSFRRCSSLRNSLKKGRVGGCIPRRTFSLRGNHPKGKNKAEKSEPVPGGSSKELNVSKESLVLDRRRKHKSFLKNLLTFRRTPATPSFWGRKGKGPGKASTVTSKSGEISSFSREISTQTSNSLENLEEGLRLLSVSTSASPSTSSGDHTPSPTLGNKGDLRGHDSDSGRYTESSEPDGKEHATPTSPGHPSSLRSKDEDDAELRRLLSPTPTPSSSSSAGYLFNNPYRRRYLGQYQQYPHTNSVLSPKSCTLSSSTPSSLISTASSSSFKYPPRPWEKRAIYERLTCAKKPLPIRKLPQLPLTKQLPTRVENPGPALSAAATSSNVQVEVLLPLGKLINQVHSDFKDDAEKEPKTPQNGNMFTFKSSLSSNTSTEYATSEVEVDVKFTSKAELRPGQGLIFRRNLARSAANSGIETISQKPVIVGERESII